MGVLPDDDDEPIEPVVIIGGVGYPEEFSLKRRVRDAVAGGEAVTRVTAKGDIDVVVGVADDRLPAPAAPRPCRDCGGRGCPDCDWFGVQQ